MGSKANPKAFRIPTTYSIPSKWFASSTKQYAKNLHLDREIREFLLGKLKTAGVARIEIERAVEQITIVIYTSKPGVVIGKGGAAIEEVKAEIKRKFFGSEKMQVNISIQEVRDPDTNSAIIYQSIRDQIEARVPFRRAIKRALEQVMRAGAQGCKISVSGRLNGAEIARTEKVAQGRLPLQTLRADIDYHYGVANTIYGVIGIKVWVYKGEVFGDKTEETKKPRRKKSARGSRNRMKTSGKTTLRKKSDVNKKESAAQQPE